MTLDQFNDTAWRVRLSGSQPGLAHLSLTDHRLAVTRGALDAALDTARSIGATHVRTSALSDESTGVLNEAGFVGVDRLVLLRRTISRVDRPRVLQPPFTQGLVARQTPTSQTRTRDQIRLRRLSRRWLAGAARVDAAAFGPTWSIDRDGLADIRTATPTTWGRRAVMDRPFGRPERHGQRDGANRRMAGFVMCGASGDDAYIQRLAVDPAFQGRRVATALVTGALAWMATHGATNVLVNTRPDNDAALALYEGLGFQRLAQQLIVAERSV